MWNLSRNHPFTVPPTHPSASPPTPDFFLFLLGNHGSIIVTFYMPGSACGLLRDTISLHPQTNPWGRDHFQLAADRGFLIVKVTQQKEAGWLRKCCACIRKELWLITISAHFGGFKNLILKTIILILRHKKPWWSSGHERWAHSSPPPPGACAGTVVTLTSPENPKVTPGTSRGLVCILAPQLQAAQ